ncbi:MAG TPA: HAD hydrolase family protein [Galbitalea sp.]|nr:HAD hydrolase family protein [Galbitalea sp.]
MTASRSSDRWLIALDVDGTVLREDGTLSDEVTRQVARVSALGHVVTLATGRAVATTLPVLDRLGVAPRFVVCANGAITLRRESIRPLDYVEDSVETFDPSEVLTTIRGHLAAASFGVEDEHQEFLYSGPTFPDSGVQPRGRRVEFDDLLAVRATRVVVISPEHAVEDFLAVVERMGLHRVSYTVGWTAWLDIAPSGVNKAFALEKVRKRLRIPRTRVLAIGDGRNDIDMLEWASRFGRGIAMGQAPDEVRDASNELTGSHLEDGVATVLASFPG